MPEKLDNNNKRDPLREMKTLNNWVGYKLIQRDGRISKMPIDPHTGKGAKADDASTWGSYEQALEAVKNYNLDGVGFEFGVDFQGYVGIDLDHVLLEDGTLKPFAAEIVNDLNSYTEYSPSGTGIHAFCKADTSMENWEYGQNVSHRNDSIGVEIYDKKRYFTVTEKTYGEVKNVANRSSQLKEVYRKYLHKEKLSSQESPQMMNVIPPIPTYFYEFNTISQGDRELWDKMFASLNGQKIKSLFNGDTSDYSNDDSRADLALCNYLAYWTGNDIVRMDRMFRQSKLMRDKWDSGNSPKYGERTIQTAIEKNGYQVSASLPQIEIPQGIWGIPISPVVANNTSSDDLSVSDYLDNLFDNDINIFKNISGLKTGFRNLDAVTSLYPGLYLLGAVPGLGKTTFATQLADNLSLNGEHVLFFSLEQKRMELVTKGLSRLTVNNNHGSLSGLTSIQIRELGKKEPLVTQAIEKYKTFSQNELFICCGFTTFEFIRDKVQNYIRDKKVRPVVIIDYIQIIQPSDTTKNATKDVIDNHVREFKKLQASHDLVLIIISSLNRANYAAPIDYESFKETGSLEYTCDVIWGLQLQIMNDLSMSGKNENLNVKREKIRTAKSQIPRKLELVCIKNRFGSNYSCMFDYYAPYDLFIVPNVQGVVNQVINKVPVMPSAHI